MNPAQIFKNGVDALLGSVKAFGNAIRLLSSDQDHPAWCEDVAAHHVVLDDLLERAASTQTETRKQVRVADVLSKLKDANKAQEALAVGDEAARGARSKCLCGLVLCCWTSRKLINKMIHDGSPLASSAEFLFEVKNRFDDINKLLTKDPEVTDAVNAERASLREKAAAAEEAACGQNDDRSAQLKALDELQMFFSKLKAFEGWVTESLKESLEEGELKQSPLSP